MKRHIKQLIILYISIVVLKILLSSFILAPSAFSDDYGYTKAARSFFYHGTFEVHGVSSTRPFLYPVILSVTYIFEDMEIVFFFMKVINALISSLIILPAWWLSKEFFNERKAMLLTVIIAILPAHFGFTFFFMQEVLFFPLFLFSIYFIYKSFIEESYKWDILAGIFIGLTYLSKVNAVSLIFSILCAFLFKIFKKDYGEIKKKVIMASFFVITILPLLIRNYSIFGFSKNLFFGGHGESINTVVNLLVNQSRVEYVIALLVWFVLYAGYLMLASGFILFLTNFFIFKKSDNKRILIFSILTLSSLFFVLCLASRSFKLGVAEYHTLFMNIIGHGRVMGRYTEVIIPLIIINGVLGFKYFKKIPLVYYILSIIVLIFSSQLIFFPLFPINNMSLAWLGILKMGFDFLIYKKITFESIFSYWYIPIFIAIFITILLFTVYLRKKLSIKNLLYLFIIFFSIVNLLNFVGIGYNTYIFWYKGEQTQLGLWFNKYDPKISTVLFDERDGCKIFKTNQTCIYNPFTSGGSATLIGFWMNDEIKIGSVDNFEGVDYVVSRHKLNLPLLKETKNGIFLYKADEGNES